MVDWNLKLVALLHDPPDKAYEILGHEKRSFELLNQALGASRSDGEWKQSSEWERAKQADQIASAADRFNFFKGVRVDFRSAPLITHPLAGRRALDLFSQHTADPGDAPLRVVTQLCKPDDDPRQRYLRFWRGLLPALRNEAPEIGALWEVLPPETRQPDHGIHQHASTTAALASALPEPALLTFSIAGAQRFVEAARRTQDLWMGSFLLSYLMWQAIQSVASEFGPDTILYPALLGQPLADRWLYGEGVWEHSPNPEELALPTLPNKFVALLPAAEAPAAARQAEQALRDEWRRVSSMVRQKLAEMMVVNAAWETLWEHQIADALEIYWSVFLWPKEPNAEEHEQFEKDKSLNPINMRAYRSVQQYCDLLRPGEKPAAPGESSIPGQVFKVYWDYRRHQVNIGTAYAMLDELADRGFEARKGLRNFAPMEAAGEKCTMCGQRSALHTGDDRLGAVRRYWGDLAERFQAQGEFTQLKPNGAERLCAVCAVKRFVHRMVFKEELFDNEMGYGDFLSTSAIAVAPFWAAVLDRMADHAALADFVRELEWSTGTDENEGRRSIPATVRYEALPASLRRRLRDQPDLARALVGYEGEFLFPDTYTCEWFVSNLDLDFDDDTLARLRKALNDLLEVAREADIPSPSRYYAVLAMDGDKMGEWLQGSHPNLPEFQNVLHLKAVEQLKSLPAAQAMREEWEKIMKARRLISPAYHAALSHALANFALRCVRLVVEEKYNGRVVYAGGDDVLALLPVSQVLAAARDLRALFGGQVKSAVGGQEQYGRVAQTPDGPAFDVDLVSDQPSGYIVVAGEPVMVMGPQATASVGVAIAHHNQPLSTALEAARRAEKAAKNLYGRNAIAVTFLKRSGEVLRMGTQWYYSENPAVPDAAQLLDEVRRCLADNWLSAKLPYAFFEKARTLAALDNEALEKELGRLIGRHKGKNAPKDDEGKAWAADLSHQLAQLAMALNAYRCKWDKDWRKHHPDRAPDPVDEDEVPQPGAVELGKWLLLARALAAVEGGGE